MAQDFGSPVQPIPQPKRNNTVLIIVIAVLALLCCCCVVIVGGWSIFQPVFLEIWNTYSLAPLSGLIRLF